MELSILIPTYNEADIIGSTLREIAKELGEKICKDTEVIIVDDGTDELPQTVKALEGDLPFSSIDVIRNSPPLGKGRSLAAGFQRARGKIAGFLDADLSTPPSYIKQAIAEIKSDQTDIFIGSRRAADSKVRRKQSAIKDVLGNMLIVGVNAVIFTGGKSYKDTQCGFKFFKAPLARVLYRDLVAGDGLNDIEVLIRANMLGYRVHEQGVTWTDERESKRSLKRIIVGEIIAISRILYHYRLFGADKMRKLREFE